MSGWLSCVSFVVYFQNLNMQTVTMADFSMWVNYYYNYFIFLFRNVLTPVFTIILIKALFKCGTV